MLLVRATSISALSYARVSSHISRIVTKPTKLHVSPTKNQTILSCFFHVAAYVSLFSGRLDMTTKLVILMCIFCTRVLLRCARKSGWMIIHWSFITTSCVIRTCEILQTEKSKIQKALLMHQSLLSPAPIGPRIARIQRDLFITGF